MKFVLLSDIHASSKNPVARTDSLLQTFIKKFKFILDYAQEYNAIVLQSGDFFNKPRDWHILFAMFDLLDEYSEIKIYTIMGQHDSYMRAKITHSPTTIGALAKTGYLQVLGKRPIRYPINKKKQVYIYGAGWGQKIPIPKGEKNILVIHLSISKVELFPNHQYIEPDLFSAQHKDYDLILVGDIHRQLINIKGQTTLVNTGPILRRDGDDYNFKHHPSFFVWDSKYNSLEKIQIPHEPAQRVLRHVSTIPEEQTEEEFSELAEQIQKTWDEVKPHNRIKEIIKKIIKKKKTSRKAKKIIEEVLEDDG